MCTFLKIKKQKSIGSLLFSIINSNLKLIIEFEDCRITEKFHLRSGLEVLTFIQDKF